MAADDSEPGKERRRHRRFPIDRALSARTKNGRRRGRLKDISAGGAGIMLDDALDAGDDVTLDIDDLGTHAGHVAGPSRYDLIPIAFDNDEEDQELLIAEIMRCQSGMVSGEDI